MRTVSEVSRITGVSTRTLHYYDSIGLFTPSSITAAGYRMYDEKAILKLRDILVLRELQFPLKEICRIINSPEFEKDPAFDKQIELLEMKKKQLSDLITFARGIKITGVSNMNYDTFDKSGKEDYAEQAKAIWGKTMAYKEYEKRSANYSESKKNDINEGLMDIFRRMGEVKDKAPGAKEAQGLVTELKEYITANFYTCTDEILSGLGEMYAGGGSMTDNIDAAGGKGTALFSSKAIAEYCARA